MDTTQTEPRAAALDPTLGLRRRTVTLSVGEIACLEQGEGPVVLLLHGAPVTSLGFVRVIRELAEHYRVIAPDLPGFGGSLAAEGYPGTLRDHARFVTELCDALRLDAFFVYLNDASACIGFFGLAPLAHRIRGLIVASTVPLPLTGRIWPVKMILRHVVGSTLVRLLNRRFNLFAWLVATVAPWLRPFPATERAAMIAAFDTPEKRDRTIDLFSQMGRDDAFMHAAAAAAGRFADARVLLLYGQFDPMRLIGAVPMYRRLFRDAEVVIVPREQHFPILAEGVRVAREIHAWIERGSA